MSILHIGHSTVTCVLSFSHCDNVRGGVAESTTDTLASCMQSSLQCKKVDQLHADCGHDARLQVFVTATVCSPRTRRLPEASLTLTKKHLMFADADRHCGKIAAAGRCRCILTRQHVASPSMLHPQIAYHLQMDLYGNRSHSDPLAGRCHFGRHSTAGKCVISNSTSKIACSSLFT